MKMMTLSARRNEKRVKACRVVSVLMRVSPHDSGLRSEDITVYKLHCRSTLCMHSTVTKINFDGGLQEIRSFFLFYQGCVVLGQVCLMTLL